MIYNLCSERDYPDSYFHGNVRRFPFDDHNAPPLQLMYEFCKDTHEFLIKNVYNVAGIHCKAGKGRTGTVICAYLVYNGECETADQALALYAINRTLNKK